MAEVFDPLLVNISEPGFPDCIRLAVPDVFCRVEMQPDAWAIVRVPASALMAELDKEQHTDGYPKYEKIGPLLEAFRNSVPIGVPIIAINDRCKVPDFWFEDGRHRIKVLSQLGAETIPVAVPWIRAEEFIRYFLAR